jgi:dinuclear metal center YbgI/SA1388 family protein
MATINKVGVFLDGFLQSSKIKDYCPNGLQVEGSKNISKIISGVSASEKLIDKAIELKADTILVHHGLIWNKDSHTITGSYGRKIKKLLDNNINLFAYHLPLDIHKDIGNNACLANIFGARNFKIYSEVKPSGLLWYGDVEEQSGFEFAQMLENKLEFSPHHIEVEKNIKTIAWCSGGAQYLLKEAKEKLDVDAFISGEISESTVHYAIENDIHYFSAGHHATERYGVQALGKILASEFDLEHIFIDLPISV